MSNAITMCDHNLKLLVEECDSVVIFEEDVGLETQAHSD